MLNLHCAPLLLLLMVPWHMLKAAPTTLPVMTTDHTYTPTSTNTHKLHDATGLRELVLDTDGIRSGTSSYNSSHINVTLPRSSMSSTHKAYPAVESTSLDLAFSSSSSRQMPFKGMFVDSGKSLVNAQQVSSVEVHTTVLPNRKHRKRSSRLRLLRSLCKQLLSSYPSSDSMPSARIFLSLSPQDDNHTSSFVLTNTSSNKIKFTQKYIKQCTRQLQRRERQLTRKKQLRRRKRKPRRKNNSERDTVKPSKSDSLNKSSLPSKLPAVHPYVLHTGNIRSLLKDEVTEYETSSQSSIPLLQSHTTSSHSLTKYSHRSPLLSTSPFVNTDISKIFKSRHRDTRHKNTINLVNSHFISSEMSRMGERLLVLSRPSQHSLVKSKEATDNPNPNLMKDTIRRIRRHNHQYSVTVQLHGHCGFNIAMLPDGNVYGTHSDNDPNSM